MSSTSRAPSRTDPRRKLGTRTATMLVVASMIGTGVFTTTGFLVRDVGSPIAVLCAWIAGGILAFCGATAYAELGAAFPRSGAEYALITRVWSRGLGFAFGFTSVVVGFVAPIGASAIAFGSYLDKAIPGVIPPLASAIVLIAALTLLHSISVETGSRWQDILTALKIGLIIIVAGAGLFLGDVSRIVTEPQPDPLRAITSPLFAVGLIFVSYAYSGWNGAAYVAGEVKDPSKNLPRALIAGSAIVTTLYVALNAMYFASASPQELSGVVEVAYVAASKVFGENGGRLLALTIALGLIPTTGAFLMTGARVAEEIGADYKIFAFLARRTEGGSPAIAIGLMSALAAIMVLTQSFDTLLTYVGFTLSIACALTVAGVIRLRIREPNLERPYRTWGYPVTPLIFVAVTGWMVFEGLREQPAIALFGLGTIGLGLALYGLVRRTSA